MLHFQKKLVNKGTNLSLQDYSGATPLMTAVMNSHSHVLSLIKNTSVVDIHDRFGKTGFTFFSSIFIMVCLINN